MWGIAGGFRVATPLPPEVFCGGGGAVLAHPGPDNFGSWREHGVSLFHWRLAIIDLSAAGNQQMLSADQRFVLCYNGEVYNFQQLRAEIETQWQCIGSRHSELTSVSAGSFRWRGHSD